MAKTLYTKEVNAGALKSTSSKAYKFKLEVIENSTSEANDSSNITINFYGSKYSGWGFAQLSSPRAVLTVDGNADPEDGVLVSAINSTSYIKISTWSGDIKHNAEGKKTLSVKAVFDPHLTASSGYNYAPVKTQIEASVPLTTIPQKSSITATDAEIEGNTKIEIKRASDSFTHTLKYSFNGLTGTVATKTSNTSISWTIPTSFYAKIPNSKKGTCTITCETYNGSTLIGSSTCTFEASCNESKCKPSLSATIVDINESTIAFTGTNSKLIRYKSTAKITPTATAKNSATISKITVDNVAVNGSLNINNVDRSTFKIVATDSRGFSTSLDKTVVMIPYVQLTCSFKVKRKSAISSKVKLSGSGNYYNSSLGTTNNTLTLSWKYREKGATTWITGGNITTAITDNTYSFDVEPTMEFNYKKAYDFIVYYSDKLNDLDVTQSIKRGIASLGVFELGIKVNDKKIFVWNNENNDTKLGIDFLNMIYPIGSIYMSVNGTSPNTLFGGTWERIQGKFLLAGNDSVEEYKPGKTGGTTTHNHSSGSLISDLNFQQGGVLYNYKPNASCTYNYKETFTYTEANTSGSLYGGVNVRGNTDNANNMPPFLSVYVWKRVS